jgi:hypothetical protein
LEVVPAPPREEEEEEAEAEAEAEAKVGGDSKARLAGANDE